MTHLIITGPVHEACRLALQRFNEYAAAGRHALLDTPEAGVSSSDTGRRLSAAHVLITVREGPAPLSETTTTD